MIDRPPTAVAGPRAHTPTAPRPGELTTAATTGVLWQGASYVGGKLLVLGATVVLARILVPEDFGLVALALVFVGYAEVATDVGLSQALVYYRHRPRMTDQALSAVLVVSAALVVAANLAAPAVGAFFRRPDVVPMFRVLSLSLLIAGAAQVPDALLRREMRFRDRTIGMLARSAGRGAIAIGLALSGVGAWSIVIGHVAGDVLYTAVLWHRAGHRPSLSGMRPRLAEQRTMLAYGLPAAGAGLLSKLVFDLDYLVVGRVLGATALGLYTMAFRVPELAIVNVFFVFSAVAFPAYSAAREDPDRLRRGYLLSVRLQSAYGLMAGVGLAIVAPLLVGVLLGERWTGSIVPLQAIALYAAFRAVGAGTSDVYKAIGRPNLAIAMSALRLAVVAPVLVVTAPHGIAALAFGQAAAAVVLAVVTQAVAARVIDVPLGRLAAALGPSVGAAAATGLAAWFIARWIPGPDAVVLVTAIVGAGLAGLATLWMLDPGAVRALAAGQLRRRLQKATP